MLQCCILYQISLLEEEGKLTNIAMKMIAKDGEEVDFHEPCVCDEQVFHT